VHINKFAELNLIGFYELASQFGGVEVCVSKWPGGDGYQEGANLTDPIQYNPAEGQDAGSGSVVVPGLQHLSPMQTLDFVRARHNLPQGDIDRTYRQQAVLDYVLWKLKTEGGLADAGKLGPLLTVAKEYLAVPKGWNLLQFAGELDGLTPQTLTFHTLPSTPGPDVPGVGDVNDVHVAQIQAQVQQAFSAPPGGGTAPAAASPASTSKSGTASGGSAKKAPAQPVATVPPPAGLGGRKAGAQPAATPTPAPSISYAADGSVSAASATLAKKALAEYGIPCVY
jgi:anionic cell wall polymer biosynthesis LytR-Cps2A-Psr (LCP) family protein